MYTCGIRINANLVKEGSFRINAKLVKEELTLITLKYLLYTMDTKGFFQFKIIIDVLVSPFRFIEYFCYGSTAIRNILILSVRGSSLYVRI